MAHSASQHIILKVDGQSLKLTPSILERLFANTESSLQKGSEVGTNTSGLATRFVGHYGLKTPQDVIIFLNSPGGKTVLGMIAKELAEIAAIENQTRHDLLEKQLLEKRILAFLLMGLLYRRKAHADELNEEARHIAEKRDTHRTEETAASTAVDDTAQDIIRSLEAFERTSDALENVLNDKLATSETLEKELAQASKDIHNSTRKYVAYNQQVHKISDETMGLIRSIPEVQKRIETLTQMIDRIAEELNTNATKISRLLDADNIEAARFEIENSNASNLAVGVLKDMLAVIKGEKVLYTAQGKPTTNFKESEFILAKDKKLVLDNGKYYLLNADENLADLSTENKEKSERAYLRLRPEIMGVKQLIKHNQQLEHRELAAKQKPLSERSEKMQQEIELLAKQLAEVQAARASLQVKLQVAAPHTPIPRPNPKAVHSLTESYRHLLALMRDDPTPSKNRIDWLKSFQKTVGQVSPTLQKQLNELKPGNPIPPTLIKELLRRKPANLPQCFRSELTPLEDSTLAAPSTAPTPFSMRPRPR